MNTSIATAKYRAVGTSSGVDSADPHKLIALLLTGAINKTNLAKAAIEKGDIAMKGELIGKVISIVEYLRVSLEVGIDAEFATNLADLYSYMEVRLSEANIESDVARLDEVLALLGEIEPGWQGIPEEYRK